MPQLALRTGLKQPRRRSDGQGRAAPVTRGDGRRVAGCSGQPIVQVVLRCGSRPYFFPLVVGGASVPDRPRDARWAGTGNRTLNVAPWPTTDWTWTDPPNISWAS